MTDEVSTYTGIAVVVVGLSQLCIACIGIMMMSINIVNNMGNTYSEVVNASTMGQLTDCTKLESLSAPSAYSAITTAIDFVDKVVYIHEDGTEELVYQYNNNTDNLIWLATKYRLENINLSTVQGTIDSNLYTVTLKVVD